MPSAAIASATSARWRSLADAVEDDAGDAHGRIVRGKAAHHGRRRLRLPRHVEHQHDRQDRNARRDRRSRRAGRRRRRAVEQAHDAFDDENIGVVGGLRGERIEQCRRHRPGIEIDARRAGGGGMERRIDVIGPGFRRAHRDAAPGERREQRERHRRLAGAGMRRGDDEPARGHDAGPSSRCRVRAEQLRAHASRCRR